MSEIGAAEQPAPTPAAPPRLTPKMARDAMAFLDRVMIAPSEIGAFMALELALRSIADKADG